MDWLNIPGTVFVILLLIPNILYAVTNKSIPEEKYHNKPLEILEQVGRFGCILLMVFDTPGRGYCACGAREAYLILSGVLMAAYWLGWVVFWKENSLERALVLSIVPSLLFMESGLLTRNIPLVILSLLFAVCHITISCKNAA